MGFFLHWGGDRGVNGAAVRPGSPMGRVWEIGGRFPLRIPGESTQLVRFRCSEGVPVMDGTDPSGVPDGAQEEERQTFLDAEEKLLGMRK